MQREPNMVPRGGFARDLHRILTLCAIGLVAILLNNRRLGRTVERVTSG